MITDDIFNKSLRKNNYLQKLCIDFSGHPLPEEVSGTKTIDNQSLCEQKVRKRHYVDSPEWYFKYRKISFESILVSVFNLQRHLQKILISIDIVWSWHFIFVIESCIIFHVFFFTKSFQAPSDICLYLMLLSLQDENKRKSIPLTHTTSNFYSNSLLGLGQFSN